jgi:drug/metabolite transporter (DMT)-like permease
MVSFWSFNYVAGKVALREIPPVLLVALRTVLAAALMLPFYLWREVRKTDGWDWAAVRLLAPLCIGGIALNQLFFTVGLAHTSVAHAGIVIALTPILVLLLAAAFGQERLTARKLVGMTVALAGVLVLQVTRNPGSNATPAGDLIVLLGAIALALFTVMGKRFAGRYDGLTVNTIAYVGGGLLLTPFAWWEGARFSFRSVSPQAWWGLFYMAAFSSVIAYMIFYYALKHASASRVSVFSYLQPLLATLMAIPILREQVSGTLLIGGSLALAGVYVTERS